MLLFEATPAGVEYKLAFHPNLSRVWLMSWKGCTLLLHLRHSSCLLLLLKLLLS
jgi:hypothetical protein